MRTFTIRRNMENAPHNADQKNAPEQPQFEGVLFSDGSVAIRWLTARRSTAVWASMEDMLAIHGHPEYGSELIWHDEQQDSMLRTLTAEVRALKHRVGDILPPGVHQR